MSRPWMPLYVADYLADTEHLGALESGAYLHLIMHYWQKHCLPTDVALLARIARLTPEQWAQTEPVLLPFFEDGWRHKRIEKEIKSTNDAYERRSIAGRKGGIAKAKKLAMPQHENKQCSSNHNYKERKKDSDAIASGATAPIDDDPKQILFSEGLRWLKGLQPESSDRVVRALLGKMLRDCGGDTHAGKLLGIFRDTRRERKSDPIGWIWQIIAGYRPRDGPTARPRVQNAAIASYLEKPKLFGDEPDPENAKFITHIPAKT